MSNSKELKKVFRGVNVRAVIAKDSDGEERAFAYCDYCDYVASPVCGESGYEFDLVLALGLLMAHMANEHSDILPPEPKSEKRRPVRRNITVI